MKIRVNKPMMLEMKQRFEHGAEELDNMIKRIEAIANEVEGGALQGEAGDALVEALRAALVKQMATLCGKFYELANDIQVNINIADDVDDNVQDMVGL